MSVPFLATCIRQLALGSLLLVGCSSPSLVEKADVIVLSTLHGYHESVEAYDYGILSEIIVALEPDVLLVELTDQELGERKTQQTKTEYQHSVYPVLAEHKYVTIALEPSGATRDAILHLAKNGPHERVENNPELGEKFGPYISTLYDILLEIWDSPASVNSALTDLLIEAKHELQNDIYGPTEVSVWQGWNQHFLDTILTAAKAHPGKRLLVLVGAEHGYWQRGKLKSIDYVNLLDTEALLIDLD